MICYPALSGNFHCSVSLQFDEDPKWRWTGFGMEGKQSTLEAKQFNQIASLKANYIRS